MSSATSGPPEATISPSAAQEIAAANGAASDSDPTNLRIRRAHLNPTGLTASSPEPSKTNGQPSTPSYPHHHAITNAILSPPLGEFFINLLLQVAGIVAAIAFGVFAVESLRVAKDANTLATQAIEEARVANQVAMLALCTQVRMLLSKEGKIAARTNSSKTQQSTGNAPSFCNRVLGNENSVLQSEATALFTAKVSSTLIPTPVPPPSESSSASTTTASRSTGLTTSTNGPSGPTTSATPPATGAGSAPASSGPSRGVIIGIAVPVGIIFMMVLFTVTLFCIRRRKKAPGVPELSAPFPAFEGLPQGTLGDQGPYDTTVPGKEGPFSESRPVEKGWRRWWNIYQALFMESRVSTRN